MAEQNPFAPLPVGMKVTADAAAFVEKTTFDAIPAEALRIGTR